MERKKNIINGVKYIVLILLLVGIIGLFVGIAFRFNNTEKPAYEAVYSVGSIESSKAAQWGEISYGRRLLACDQLEDGSFKVFDYNTEYISLESKYLICTFDDIESVYNGSLTFKVYYQYSYDSYGSYIKDCFVTEIPLYFNQGNNLPMPRKVLVSPSSGNLSKVDFNLLLSKDFNEMLSTTGDYAPDEGFKSCFPSELKENQVIMSFCLNYSGTIAVKTCNLIVEKVEIIGLQEVKVDE